MALANDRNEDELQRRRDEYRRLREEVRAAKKHGAPDDALRTQCVNAKEKLRELLKPGESVLGGAPITHSKDKPISRRVPISPRTLASIPSPLPEQLRLLQVFCFDTVRFPFREIVAEIIGLSEEQLPKLHEISHLDQNLDKYRTDKWVNRWHASQGSTARLRFSSTLNAFVTEFCAPRMQPDFNHDVGICSSVTPLAYQRDVTFRVQPPSTEAMGYLHADADYHHPPAEVNWWVPLTHVWSPNTLHIESLPGKGDFAPVELEYGQALRFYGNLCQHHTIANTSEFSRVSFDFRILHLAYHDPEWLDQHGRKCAFEIGTYYQVVDGSELSEAHA